MEKVEYDSKERVAIFVSPETRNRLKSQAAQRGLSLIAYLAQLAYEGEIKGA